mgnify:CR=1 FL=1
MRERVEEAVDAVRERFPEAEVTGLDSTPEMVFAARELGIEVRLARMEDPLPDGPWDLVLSVLSVHHLTDDQKRLLFRRVREQSRALVIGDVVKARISETLAEVEAEAGTEGLRTRRTGTSVSVLGVEAGNGFHVDGERRPANLEDVFVLLTGEEIG